jgi:hypothetical protein
MCQAALCYTISQISADFQKNVFTDPKEKKNMKTRMVTLATAVLTVLIFAVPLAAKDFPAPPPEVNQTLIFYTLYSDLGNLGWGLGSIFKSEPDFLAGVNVTTAILVTRCIQGESERRAKP